MELPDGSCPKALKETSKAAETLHRKFCKDVSLTPPNLGLMVLLLLLIVMEGYCFHTTNIAFLSLPI